MEDIWLARAKRLQALAATGLHFSEEEYDLERYHEVDMIAREMMADLGKVPLAALAGLPSAAEGYATPKIDVRAAVVRDDKVLLVREARDGLWTLPGGFADVGLSAAENAVKETWEEATLRVSVVKLIQVRHRAKSADEPDYLDFYKFFFLCEADARDDPMPGPETTDAQFLSVEELPPMSLGRSNPEDVSRALRHAQTPNLTTEWD